MTTTVGPTLALGLDPSGIERGADVARGAINQVGQAARRTSDDVTGVGKSLDLIKQIAVGSLAGFTAGFGIQTLSKLPAAFVRISDEIAGMENRLRLATASTAEFRTAYAAVISIASEVGVPTGAVADLYSRLSMAASDLGTSQKDLEKFTRAVSQAIAVSGSTASQTSGAMLQLSQIIGGGTVRAEEFNSVLDSVPRLARAAAAGFDGTGTSVANLRKAIAAGEVTSRQFFDAILGQSDVLQSEMDHTADTVGRAGTAMADAIGQLIKRLNDAVGATKTLASGMRYVTREMSELVERTSNDAQTKLKRLEKDLENAKKPWTLLGFQIPWEPGAQTYAKQGLRDLIEKIRPEAEQNEFESARDDIIRKMTAESRKIEIPAPKPKMLDVAQYEIEERNARLAKAAKQSSGDAEAAARRVTAAHRELATAQAKILEDAGRYAEAAKLRASVDIEAWRDQAREAKLSAAETQRGIDMIQESYNRSVAERMSVGQKLLAEMTVMELDATGKTREAAEERTKIAISEWRDRARAAGLSIEQIAQGERSLTAAARAEADQRLADIGTVLSGMEATELEKNGKAVEAAKIRSQIDVDAWKKQAAQAGLSADKTARGIQLIENQYKQATDTGSKFLEAMGDAAEAVATRMGDEFTSMFMTIVTGGKLTAQQITDTFAKITISTLMQTVSRWAINSISQELQIGKAVGGLAGVFGTLFGGSGTTTSGAEGQTTIGHGVGGDTLGAHAAGAAIERGNVVPFAAGGAIASDRTAFPMRHGYGVMGEAGPEGIFPLTRTSGGHLGIRAEQAPISVKINNYGDARVSARQSSDGLTVDIDSIVADVVARRGSRSNRAVRGVR